jgi:hypothetical protein
MACSFETLPGTAYREVGVRHPHGLRLGAVDEVAEDPADPADGLAVRRHASLAVPAAAAFRDGRDQHAITDRESLDRPTDLGDGADSFMTEDAALGDRGDIALEDVQVGAADRSGVDPHHHVRRFLDRRVRNLFPCLLPGPVIDQRLHSHLRW